MNEAGPSPWRLQKHVQLESTQKTAIEAAQAGDAGFLAVLADAQTAGRGSRGRIWVAPAGNLNLSLMLRPHEMPDPGYWAMLAGVTLHAALAHFTAGLMLKWPNDLMLHGAKLGGILIDSSVLPNGRLDWVVIGMGANLAHAPACEGRQTARLPGPAPTPADIAARVLAAFDCWAGTDIQSAWLARAHPPGTAIDVVTRHRRLQGRFAGLTSRGELLLEGCGSPISSAEIFLSRPHTPSHASETCAMRLA